MCIIVAVARCGAPPTPSSATCNIGLRLSQEPDGLDCNFRHPFGERNEDPNDTSPQSEPGVAVLAKNLPKEPKEPEKEWGELGESKVAPGASGCWL